MNEPTNEWCD